MADENINIRVSVEGSEQAARQMGTLESAVREEGQAAEVAGQAHRTAGDRVQDFARGGTAFVQRVQGMAGAIQGLVGALGSENRTAGLVASVAGATTQFAMLGSTFGPFGTAIGGAVGAVTSMASALADMSNEAAAAERAMESMASQVGAANGTLDDYRERLEAVAHGTAANALFEEGLASPEEYEARIAYLSDELTERERIREALLDQLEHQDAILENNASSFDDVVAAEAAARRLREVYEQTSAEVRELNADLERTRAISEESARETAEIMMEDLVESARPARRRRPRVAAEDPVDDEAWLEQMSAEAEAEGMRREEARQEELERIQEFWDAQDEMREEHYASELEAEREKQDWLLEIRRDAAREANELREEMYAQATAQEESATEAREAEMNQIMNFVQKGTKAVFTAIAQVAVGAKTGEDAFKGLLAAFLEMISEWASISAAGEFAQAAKDFASYNYGGGVAHVAAGVLFTAVAVATGVGAAAISAPPAAPARPEVRAESGASGGSVTNVINWNSPVVTAGTRAELGREIGYMLGDAA